MYAALSPGAIGVTVRTLEEGFEAAKIGGFQGLEVNIHEVAERVERDGASAVNDLFRAHGVLPAGWGLPTEWRGDEAKFRASLLELPRLAAAAQKIGCLRTATWILPFGDIPLEENRKFHVERFTPIARILADHGVSVGLEFIGPKTLRDQGKYPFIYQMWPMLEMAADIGPNVGLLLDCWHWYTSHGNLADLEKLTPEDVVYVHVNDAPAGVEIDLQVDNVRCLPGETGAIDIAGFLGTLRQIGYDGPVIPEPFKEELGGLPDDSARLRLVGEAMRKIGL